MQGKVEICGVNTAKLKVLKTEETMELLRRVKQGDMEAREQLIAGNLRLVLSVIQKFSGRGENADDLFQVGCIGLIKAIDNFNTDLDVRFSTYGVPTIIHLGKCVKLSILESGILNLNCIRGKIYKKSTADSEEEWIP